jgi:hypothetical protein
MISTEDKLAYCQLGLEKEIEFLENVAPHIGLNATMNPEKFHNPYVADLIVNDNIADLKYQNEPFFKAKQLFGISPQYAISLNVKDVERYSVLYPDIHIYFWVQRPWIERYGETIKAMEGVWGASLKKIKLLIQSKENKHRYLRRVFDNQGNAKESYILDLNDLTLIKRII